MVCEVCLSEKRYEGFVLRTFGLNREVLRKVLSGISFRLEEKLAGIDVFFENAADLREAKERLGDAVYSEGEPMEEVVGRILRERKLSLSVAESCTGGMLSARIVNVPGSSEYFVGGVVVYSNDLKVRLLGVREETLRKFGAVSEETCGEMLRGLKERFGTDCGVAITGIAGPGGTENKPEGLTYVGVYVKDRTHIARYIFSKGRNSNRFLSTQTALDLLRRLVLKEVP